MLAHRRRGQDHGGNGAVAAAYTAFGEHLHTSGRAPEIREGDYRLIDSAVAAAGLPASLVARARTRATTWCWARTELALARARTWARRSSPSRPAQTTR